MFYQIFLSPQVERCAIIIYKHGIYELLHELPNQILGKGLRKLGNIRKVSKPSRMIGQCLAPPAEMKILLILAKNFRKIAIKLFPQCAISHES